MTEENSETNRPNEKVDFDMPTYLRQQREEGVVKPQRQKVRERLSAKEIRAAVDSAPEKPRSDSRQANEQESPKGPDALLDAYNFNEAGKSCPMAMVIHLREDGEVGFVSPHVPAAPPNTKKSLRRFFNESFDYAQPNQFFIFYLGGEWNVINCQNEALPIPKEGLIEIWRKVMKQNRKMH